MNDFNQFERLVANIMSHFPTSKMVVKKAYQIFCYLKAQKIKTISALPIKKISYLGNESFFGYYDKSPINIKSDFIIFNSTTHATHRKPDIRNKIDIVLQEAVSGKCQIIGKTSAYNWQQGCRLQWLDVNRFIYNYLEEQENCYKAKLFDLISQKNYIVNYPIYDCFMNNAISLNFERLYTLNADYGYILTEDSKTIYDQLNDGIFLIDLIHNNRKLLLSYADIIDTHSKSSMKRAIHKINHLMYSPDGNSFIFLHRWYSNKKKYDALMHYSILSGKCKCLSDEEMVSHCCWKDNNYLVCWLRTSSEGDKYYEVSIEDGTKKSINDKINEFNDGHPSIYNDYLLFDTYPDKSRMKKLFLFNLHENNLLQLGCFFESLKYFGITRCDLHPKWACNGNSIFIDSVHEQKRFLYQLELNNEIN